MLTFNLLFGKPIGLFPPLLVIWEYRKHDVVKDAIHMRFDIVLFILQL